MPSNTPINQSDLQQLDAEIAMKEADLIRCLQAMKNRQEDEWCEILPNSESLSDFIVNNSSVVEKYAELIVIKALVMLARRNFTPSLN